MTDIARAVWFLKQGRLVAFPTETVYGLGADATNPRAIDLIYRTKGRPSTNPLIIHVADVERAKRYTVDWPVNAAELAARFWPGPLTIVLGKRGLIPDSATAGLQTVALRVPDHALALELLRAFDGPLAAPSANRSTRVSSTTAGHVRDEFPDSAAAGGAAENEPALILDGGECMVGIESTVLDLTTATPTILRPGQITAEDLRRIIGAVQLGPTVRDQSTPVPSPGQQEIHYAPRTAAYRFEASQRDGLPGHDIGVIALGSLGDRKPSARAIALPNDPAQYAQRLYSVLRELDELGLTALYIEMPPDLPRWAGIRDRLMRATRPLS